MLDSRSYGWSSEYIVLPVASKVRMMLVVMIRSLAAGGLVPVLWVGFVGLVGLIPVPLGFKVPFWALKVGYVLMVMARLVRIMVPARSAFITVAG